MPVVLNGHIHVAGKLVAHVFEIERVYVGQDIVGARRFLLFQAVVAHGDVGGERVALFHSEVIHAVLRLVVFLRVVHHRAEHPFLLARQVVEHGLHHEARVAAEHLVGHAHHGLYLSPVAHNFYVGRLGLNGLLFARGHHGSLAQLDVVFLDFHFYIGAFPHLHHHGLCAHHGEAQRAVVAHAHGEASVLIGRGEQAFGAFVGDVHTQLRLALFLGNHLTRHAHHVLGICCVCRQRKEQQQPEGCHEAGGRILVKTHIVEGLFEDVNKGKSEFRGGGRKPRVVHAIRGRLAVPVFLFAIAQHAQSRRSLHAPMLREHEAVAISQSHAVGIAVVVAAFQMQVVGGCEAHHTHKVPRLRTGGEPVAQFGVERSVTQLVVFDCEGIAGGFDVEREVARHSELYSQVRACREPIKRVGLHCHALCLHSPSPCRKGEGEERAFQFVEKRHLNSFLL